jgi:hypothetical protein
MADFKTHLTASTVLGVAYGGAAAVMYEVPLPTAVLAAGLCGVSGMLPDIDSGPGRPVKEITTFMAAVVPAMLFRRLLHFGMSHETIILLGTAVYVAIRFGLAGFLRRYTVHRGMFHSYVAAAIFGELTFLLAYNDDTAMRWFVAGAVVLGYMSHLVLDEMYSVQWDGRPRLKKSFGTAMKLFAEGWWPNLSAYGKFAVLGFLVLKEPGFMQQWNLRHVRQVVREMADGLPDLRELGRNGPAPVAIEKTGNQKPQKPTAKPAAPAQPAKPQSIPQPASRQAAPVPVPAEPPPKTPLAWPPVQAAGESGGVRR